MLFLRKNIFKTFISKRLFSTTSLNYDEILDQLPFTFNADLSLLERVDTKFQTGKSINNEILGNKDQVLKVKNLYIKLFQILAANSKFDKLKEQIEPRLFTQLDESLSYLKENSLKIGILGSSLLGQSENAIQNRIDVNHMGYLKVFEVDMNRSKNLFIHQYEIGRSEDSLLYFPKEDPREKAKPISKKEKLKQDMEASLEEKKDRPVRDAVMWAAKKIGFLTPEQLREPPKMLIKLASLRSGLYDKLEGEDHILVEDYEILSPFGIYIQDLKTKQIVKSEGKDGESFRHYLRVERLYEVKDAPSVRKQKPILLTDIDFFHRGNPHTLVKNFAEC